MRTLRKWCEGTFSLVKAGAAVAAGAAAALMLWCVPPASSSLYPVCPFHQLTGLLCPGCGGTRALAALLHGRMGEAWADNALVVMLLPVVVVYFGMGLYRQWVDKDQTWPQVSGMQALMVVTAAVLFAVGRNLA